MQAIHDELTRLHSEHWTPLIDTIISHYEGSTASSERWEPDLQILVALRRMAYIPESSYDRLIATTISRLDCFCIRVHRTTDQRLIFWDSLQTSYRKFVHSIGDHTPIREYLATHPYPAEDIIVSSLLTQLEYQDSHVPA